jgi:hypothetical protein
MIDELKLDADHAEAIVEKGIEFEVYTDDMPDSDADKMEAAHEIVSFAIDAWVNDEVRPDSDKPKVAAAGAQIVEIFEYAGITADKKGKIKFGPLPEFEGAEDEGNGEVVDGDVAFDVDDIIDDYSEMNGKQRLAALEEVMSDDGDGLYEEQVKQLLEYENEQEKPSTKVVEYLKSTIEDDGEGEGEGDGEEPEAEAEEAGEDGAEEGEPMEGYDEATIKDIKEALVTAAQDEEDPLEPGQVEYVIAYEKANKNRSSFLKWLGELYDEMQEAGDGEGEEPEAAEEPVTTKAKVGAKKAATNGSSTLTLTRDQILAALSDGEVEIEV